MCAGGRAYGSVLHRRKSEAERTGENVLGTQLDIGESTAWTEPRGHRHEPIWSGGPGKTRLRNKPIYHELRALSRERTGGMDVVYGGGLKQDNAAMLASIEEIDGGLIALTRFSGEIGFYPDEYLDIIRRYLGK